MLILRSQICLKIKNERFQMIRTLSNWVHPNHLKRILESSLRKNKSKNRNRLLSLNSTLKEAPMCLEMKVLSLIPILLQTTIIKKPHSNQSQALKKNLKLRREIKSNSLKSWAKLKSGWSTLLRPQTSMTISQWTFHSLILMNLSSQ